MASSLGDPRSPLPRPAPSHTHPPPWFFDENHDVHDSVYTPKCRQGKMPLSTSIVHIHPRFDLGGSQIQGRPSLTSSSSHLSSRSSFTPHQLPVQSVGDLLPHLWLRLLYCCPLPDPALGFVDFVVPFSHPTLLPSGRYKRHETSTRTTRLISFRSDF